MLAIEASMVARVTAATIGEVGCTAAIEEDSKAEGEEKIWGFTTAIREASKTEGEEKVCTIGDLKSLLKKRKESKVLKCNDYDTKQLRTIKDLIY